MDRLLQVDREELARRLLAEVQRTLGQVMGRPGQSLFLIATEKGVTGRLGQSPVSRCPIKNCGCPRLFGYRVRW